MNEATKFFLSRCNELLHRKTFDTYRVSIHTPISIFEELEKSIEKFSNNLIKRYDPSITSIIEEAKDILANEKGISVLFETGSFKMKQVSLMLDEIESKDTAKIDRNIMTARLLTRSVIHCNKEFKKRLFCEISSILIQNDKSKLSLLDTFSGWLMSELLQKGYSRSFVKDRINKLSKFLEQGASLHDSLTKFEETFNHEAETYCVILKIKHSSPEAFKLATPNVIVLNSFPSEHRPAVKKFFADLKEDELFISSSVESYDFEQALKISYRRIAETIDVNVLHQSDSNLKIIETGFVYHVGSRRKRVLPVAENLDGQYDYQESEFLRFIENYMKLPEETAVRDKIRSAIRFYKIGNESVELEHKILNYWIGFEQLYSSETTSEDSIKRIKTFFVAINGTYYLQRRAVYLVDLLNRIGVKYQGREICKEDLFSKDVLDIIKEIAFNDPLAYYRISCYLNLFFDKKTIKNSLERHSKRLNQNLTRIYRIRNEIVHEGKTTAELELIAGHLRHYLLFSIEQITHEHSSNQVLRSLDDVFVLFENLYNQIKSANNIKEVFELKDYQGYME